MAVKNLHLEHLEDEIINNGIDGGRSAIHFLLELRKMLKGHSNSRVNMTVKWDGAPAIWAGPHPETGKFFVAKKSLFTKAQLHYTSEQEIKDAPELTGDLENKFLIAFRYLSKVGLKEILQGDLMYTKSDIEKKKFDDGTYLTFGPNTIVYAVKDDSQLGKDIAKSQMGIVFHTTYSGSTIEGLGAKFGANIKGLKQGDVWMDDATYKDVSGTGSMTAKEALQLQKVLTTTGKAFHGIKKGDLNKFQKVMEAMSAKGASGATYKTYANSLIRANNFNPNTQDYLNYVDKYWEEKMIAKVKQEKTKNIKRELAKDFANELRGLRKMIDNLTVFQSNLVEGKMIIINALNRVKSIGTFVRTDKGFKVVNPEGYVAIDKEGGAVKLVDRMEFAYNNFTAQKKWDK